MCEEKYGVDNPMKSIEIQNKACISLLQNGTIPVSKQEKTFVKILEECFGKENCYPCHRVGRYFADCLVVIKDIKIDIEYDGFYWHKDRQDYDENRNNIFNKLGYKVLRVISKGKMPTAEQLIEAVNDLINNKSIVKINLT